MSRALDRLPVAADQNQGGKVGFQPELRVAQDNRLIGCRKTDKSLCARRVDPCSSGSVVPEKLPGFADHFQRRVGQLGAIRFPLAEPETRLRAERRFADIFRIQIIGGIFQFATRDIVGVFAGGRPNVAAEEHPRDDRIER